MIQDIAEYDRFVSGGDYFQLREAHEGRRCSLEDTTLPVPNYHQLIMSILRTAEERTPKRVSSNWLIYDQGPDDAIRIPLHSARENTVAAQQITNERVRRAIIDRKAVELDFTGLELCTQSWLHALMCEPVRRAWALRVPIHVVGAEPAVTGDRARRLRSRGFRVRCLISAHRRSP